MKVDKLIINSIGEKILSNKEHRFNRFKWYINCHSSKKSKTKFTNYNISTCN